MAPPIETPKKVFDSAHSSHPPLNERILSSMTRRSIAAHPWHDLEIGMPCTEAPLGIHVSCTFFLNLWSLIWSSLHICTGPGAPTVFNCVRLCRCSSYWISTFFLCGISHILPNAVNTVSLLWNLSLRCHILDITYASL